jgi:flagellar protein FliO/FliZ
VRLPLPVIALATLLLLPASAAAADGEKTPLDLRDAAGDAPAAAAGGGGGGALVRTIIGLVVVIAVIYGVAWVLRQVKASKETSSAGTGLETLATLALGSDRAVHLVRAGDEVVLVGSAAQGVTHLRSWTLTEATELGLLDVHATASDVGRAPAVRGVLDALREKTVMR